MLIRNEISVRCCFPNKMLPFRPIHANNDIPAAEKKGRREKNRPAEIIADSFHLSFLEIQGTDCLVSQQRRPIHLRYCEGKRNYLGDGCGSLRSYYENHAKHFVFKLIFFPHMVFVAVLGVRKIYTLKKIVGHSRSATKPTASVQQDSSTNGDINCTVTFYSTTKPRVIGFISEWISAYTFLKSELRGSSSWQSMIY